MARFLFCALILASGFAVAEEVKLSPRHVSVTGTSVAKVQPDIVVWHVNIRRANKDLAKAQAESDETVKKILELRKELKIKPEDAQTGYMSVQKIFDRDPAGNQTSFRHFLVERSITLRQHDTTRFDAVLAGLIGTADVEVSYSLESSEYLALRTKTRLEAVKAAKKKANEMTELLGGKLGRVLRIAEPQENWGTSSGIYNNNYASSAPRAAEPDQAPGTFAPGAIEVRVSIEVAFEIE